MGRRGKPEQEECINGHDLTNADNVRLTTRQRKGKVYIERQCIECNRKRAREWWEKNRGKRSDS